jgi:Domain of unknown function (DUF4142)
MVTDNSAANTELQQIAKQANIALPSQPGGKNGTEGQKLRGLNGGAFDQAYAQVSCAIIRRLWSYSRRRRVRRGSGLESVRTDDAANPAAAPADGRGFNPKW